MKVHRTIYVTNEQGFRIKKCCASCRHKMIRNEGVRICSRNHERVKPDDRCRYWKEGVFVKVNG